MTPKLLRVLLFLPKDLNTTYSNDIRMITETDTFYATLWKQGDSIVLTVPHNIIKGASFKVGDKVRVLVQKKR